MGLYIENIGANAMNHYAQYLPNGEHAFGKDLRESNKMWEHVRSSHDTPQAGLIQSHSPGILPTGHTFTQR